MTPLRIVLHPTDYSRLSKAAFRLARSLARDHGARLIVLHVAPEAAVFAGVASGPPRTSRSIAEPSTTGCVRSGPPGPWTGAGHRTVRGARPVKDRGTPTVRSVPRFWWSTGRGRATSRRRPSGRPRTSGAT
jgi:hypothetical protein